jgi:hypothetical protein
MSRNQSKENTGRRREFSQTLSRPLRCARMDDQAWDALGLIRQAIAETFHSVGVPSCAADTIGLVVASRLLVGLSRLQRPDLVVDVQQALTALGRGWFGGDASPVVGHSSGKPF